MESSATKRPIEDVIACTEDAQNAEGGDPTAEDMDSVVQAIQGRPVFSLENQIFQGLPISGIAGIEKGTVISTDPSVRQRVMASALYVTLCTDPDTALVQGPIIAPTLADEVIAFARNHPGATGPTDAEGVPVQDSGPQRTPSMDHIALELDNEQQLNALGWFTTAYREHGLAVVRPLMPTISLGSTSLVLVYTNGPPAALATFFWIASDVYIVECE